MSLKFFVDIIIQIVLIYEDELIVDYCYVNPPASIEFGNEIHGHTLNGNMIFHEFCYICLPEKKKKKKKKIESNFNERKRKKNQQKIVEISLKYQIPYSN